MSVDDEMQIPSLLVQPKNATRACEHDICLCVGSLSPVSWLQAESLASSLLPGWCKPSRLGREQRGRHLGLFGSNHNGRIFTLRCSEASALQIELIRGSKQILNCPLELLSM